MWRGSSADHFFQHPLDRSFLGVESGDRRVTGP
jgi:hypothetical protein